MNMEGIFMRMIDSHVHVEHFDIDKLLTLVDHFHYEKFCVLGIPCCGNRLNNLECLAVKARAPRRAYAYGGMVYFDGLTPTRESHEQQLRLMIDAGFDGWKILESKPSLYRRLQIPLDSAVFDGAFHLAEEAGFPITWHAGDPATFWNAATAPQFAVDNHWLCVGEGFPSLSAIYGEVETVLKRCPRLRVTLAHLYFTSDDRAHAERLLDTYENFRLDITPGSEMYISFLADREGWGRFFETYQDKLIYGTDMVDSEGDVVFESQYAITEFVQKTLMSDQYFAVRDVSGVGLGLSEAVLSRVMADNFEAIVGPAPKAISQAGLARYIAWLRPSLRADEQEKLSKIAL